MKTKIHIVFVLMFFAKPLIGSHDALTPVRDDSGNVVGATKTIINPDGYSVMLIFPRVSDKEGKQYRITANSDLDGLCQSYGYEGALKQFEVIKTYQSFSKESYEGEITVTLDKNGKGKVSSQESTSIIELVACRKNHEKTTPAKFDRANCEKITKDPTTGVVTITRPNFGIYKGKPWFIQADVDPDNLCIAFGYSGCAGRNIEDGIEPYREYIKRIDALFKSGAFRFKTARKLKEELLNSHLPTPSSVALAGLDSNGKLYAFLDAGEEFALYPVPRNYRVLTELKCFP